LENQTKKGCSAQKSPPAFSGSQAFHLATSISSLPVVALDSRSRWAWAISD